MSYDANSNQNQPQPGNPHPQHRPAQQDSSGDGSWLLDGADPSQQASESESMPQEPDAVQAWALEREQAAQAAQTSQEAWMQDMQARGEITLHEDEPDPAASFSASYCEPESTTTVLSRMLVPGVFVAAISVAGMILWKSVSAPTGTGNSVSTAGIERTGGAQDDGVKLQTPNLPAGKPKTEAPLRGRIQRDGSISVVESTPKATTPVGQGSYTPSKGGQPTSQPVVTDSSEVAVETSGNPSEWVGVRPIEVGPEAPVFVGTTVGELAQEIPADREPETDSTVEEMPIEWMAMGGFRPLPLVALPLWGPQGPGEEAEAINAELEAMGLTQADETDGSRGDRIHDDATTAEDPSEDAALAALEQWEDAEFDGEMPFVWVDESTPVATVDEGTVEETETPNDFESDHTITDAPAVAQTRVPVVNEDETPSSFDFDSEQWIASWMGVWGEGHQADDSEDFVVVDSVEAPVDSTTEDAWEAPVWMEPQETVAFEEGIEPVTEDPDGFGPEDMVSWDEWSEPQHEPALTDEEMAWLFADQSTSNAGGGMMLFPNGEHPEDSFLEDSPVLEENDVQDFAQATEVDSERSSTPELVAETSPVAQASEDEAGQAEAFEVTETPQEEDNVWTDWRSLDLAVTDRVELTPVEEPAQGHPSTEALPIVESTPLAEATEESDESTEPIFEVLPLIDYGSSTAVEWDEETPGDDAPVVAQDGTDTHPMDPVVAITELSPDVESEESMAFEVPVAAETESMDMESIEELPGDSFGESLAESSEAMPSDPSMEAEADEVATVSLEELVAIELEAEMPEEVVVEAPAMGPQQGYTGPMWPMGEYTQEEETTFADEVAVVEDSQTDEDPDAQDAHPMMQRVGPWEFPVEDAFDGELTGEVVPGEGSELLAEGEATDEVEPQGEASLEGPADSEATREDVLADAEGQPAPEASPQDEAVPMEPTSTPEAEPAQEEVLADGTEGGSTAPGQEGDLLSLYNDWTLKNDQGELPEVAALDWMGMRSAAGDASPFQLSQSGETGSGEVLVADAAPEPEEEEPKGLLRRRTADANHWSGTKIPMHAMHNEAVLLTPRVGPVRVVAPQGETIEGRLHGMGQGYVWLENNLGRMTVPARRVERIERLDPGQYRPDRRSVMDYTKLPKVRVKVKGGVFIGYELTRDGNRITIRTESGHKLTLVSDDIQPAGSFKPVNIRRDGSQ